MTSMIPKISASPSAMRAMTRPHTRPFSTWNRTSVVRSTGARSGREVSNDLRLPEVQLGQVVVERGQDDVLEAGRGQLLDAGADLGGRAHEIALGHVLPRAVRAHDALEPRALLAVRDVLAVRRHDVREVEMAERERLARAADLLEALHDLLPVIENHRVGAGGAGQPAVGAPADALQYRRRDHGGVGRQRRLDLGAAGHPEPRRPRQRRVDRQRRKLIVAAAVRDLLARPELGPEVEDLVGAPAALGQRHAGHLELRRVPAHADAQLEASAREEHEARNLLGEEDRVADGRNQDAGGELDARRRAGGKAQRLQRREPRGAVEAARGQQVLGHPERIVAERFGARGEVADPPRRGEIEVRERERRQAEPELHRGSSIGSSTNTVYFRGLLPASFGSTYMMELWPRISRGRIEQRMKLVGSVAEARAYTGSRPLSNHASPGLITRSGSPATRSSIVPCTRQRMPPPLWR